MAMLMFQSLTHPDNPIIRFANRMRWLPAALFAVAVPVFLVTGSITWAFNNIGLYEGGFEKYRIAWVSGITPEDLRQVAVELRAYFNSGAEPLDVRTRVFGAERELFNAKEIHHMYDVKRLLWGVYAAFAVSAVCLVGADCGGVRPAAPRLPTDTGPPRAVGRRADGGAAGHLRAAVRRGLSTPCSCCSTGSASPTTSGNWTRAPTTWCCCSRKASGSTRRCGRRCARWRAGRCWLWRAAGIWRGGGGVGSNGVAPVYCGARGTGNTQPSEQHGLLKVPSCRLERLAKGLFCWG